MIKTGLIDWQFFFYVTSWHRQKQAFMNKEMHDIKNVPIAYNGNGAIS